MFESLDFSSSLAILSLLVALFAIGYTVWSNHKFRCRDALQKVREVVITRRSTFNGIVMEAQSKSDLSEKGANALAQTYVDIRDIYNINRRYFSKSSRKQIDDKITILQKKYDSNPKAYNIIPIMVEVMELIEAESQ